MSTTTTYRLTFKQTLLASLMAGAGVAVANNIWKLIFESASGFSVPQIVHVPGVIMSSFLPLIVAGTVFYFISRLGRTGVILYYTGTVVLALLSLYGTFNQPMPDGSPTPTEFTLLTLPMHLIAMAGALMIPQLASRRKP